MRQHLQPIDGKITMTRIILLASTALAMPAPAAPPNPIIQRQAYEDLVLFLLAAFCCVMFGRVLVSFSAWVMS